MGFFKNSDVEKKYTPVTGDADPVIQVVIPYRGKLSEAPMVIADRLHAQGYIKLKSEPDQKPTEKPTK